MGRFTRRRWCFDIFGDLASKIGDLIKGGIKFGIIWAFDLKPKEGEENNWI